MASATDDRGDRREAEETRGSRFFRPDVDIIENKEELLLLADMPGAQRDKIDVRFEGGKLAIHAPIASRRPAGTTYLIEEYEVGDYHRSFQVSEQIDAAQIKAEYAHGVLTLHLPKAEAAKPRKISVQAG